MVVAVGEPGCGGDDAEREKKELRQEMRGQRGPLESDLEDQAEFSLEEDRNRLDTQLDELRSEGVPPPDDSSLAVDTVNCKISAPEFGEWECTVRIPSGSSGTTVWVYTVKLPAGKTCWRATGQYTEFELPDGDVVDSGPPRKLRGCL